VQSKVKKSNGKDIVYIMGVQIVLCMVLCIILRIFSKIDIIEIGKIGIGFMLGSLLVDAICALIDWIKGFFRQEKK
jgi:hypothetical protein